jgi:hypothetical protein
MTKQTPLRPTAGRLLLSQTKRSPASCWEKISKNRPYCVMLFVGFGLTMMSVSCKDFEITNVNSEKHAKEFVEGRTELSLRGFSAASGAGYFPVMKTLWLQKNWTELSKLVISANADRDYTWFMLGESARGLGLSAAAAKYYRRALADSGSIFESCGHPQDNCQGFVFPRDINRALAALRTGGN